MLSVLVLLVALATAEIPSLPQPAVNEALITFINNSPDVKWTAGLNKRFENINMKDFKKMCGTRLDGPKFPKKVSAYNGPIPDSFDARVHWSMCPSIGHIYDQGHCGSCWAMGAFEVLQDRICIQTKGEDQVALSAQDLVSCDDGSMGCNGGWPIDAWEYMRDEGIVTESCYPYAMGSCRHPGCSDWPTPRCNRTCADGTDWDSAKRYARTAYSVPSNVVAIQQEILAHGSVEAAFTVYEDFATYKSGVYHHVGGAMVGGHAIKIIGWGVSSEGTPYWLVANSWAQDWGMGGYFWILRGRNECGIESEVVAGLADA